MGGKKGRIKDIDAKAKEEKEKKSQKRPAAKVEVTSLVRISHTDINGEKNVVTGLKAIRGVNHALANAIVKVAGLDPRRKIGQLGEADIQKIEEVITSPIDFGIPPYLFNREKDVDSGKDVHLSGDDISMTTKFDIKKHIDLKTYKGFRHMLGQPVRGQKTRSHFRHGRVVGVLKKEIKLQAAEKEKKK